MALMQCRSCSAKYAVGLLRCPQCGAVSELYAAPEEVIEAEQQEANVPKISVEGGPSNALGWLLETEVAAEAVEPEATAAASEPSEQPEAEMSDATSAATDEAVEPEGDAGGDAESAEGSETEASPAPKPARKTAAKKAAAKAESAPQE